MMYIYSLFPLATLPQKCSRLTTKTLNGLRTIQTIPEKKFLK